MNSNTTGHFHIAVTGSNSRPGCGWPKLAIALYEESGKWRNEPTKSVGVTPLGLILFCNYLFIETFQT